MAAIAPHIPTAVGIGPCPFIPAELATLAQWLVWRFEGTGPKPRKVPYYANGRIRQGEQGSEADRAALGTAADAWDACQRHRMDGIGFAFLPDDGLIGIDLDDKIDPATGEVDPEALAIIARAVTYCETSPSGEGFHLIGRGTCESFKHNGIGIEVFCGRQFFTWTGTPWGDPAGINPLPENLLRDLRARVEAAKAADRAGATPRQSATSTTGYGAGTDRTTAYGRVALDNACARVASAPEGTRNDTLNAQALGIARLAAGSVIDEREALERLSEAASACGLDPREAQATLRSAFRAGATQPRSGPAEPPHVDIDMDALRQSPGARSNGNRNESGATQEEGDKPCDDGNSNIWPEPQPLTARVEPEPYPVDALPDTIRAAVEEVAGFVKAPFPLVASSALAALSVAAQAHIDVKRAEKLQGPSGLFLLTIADSGERKTTCDGFFSAPIRQFQEEQADAMRPALERYQAAADAWTAERDGVLLAIKDASKKGKPSEKLRADLADLQRAKPEPPRVPHLLLADETPENLAWRLARQWPAAGVVSSEAGLIFGAHGMGKDSVMRNLALLNTLWDGGSHSIGRRTSESFTVNGARLTVALQVQEATLRAFFDKAGPLARGTGFLARFLVAWPESTQGYRPFAEPPATWPRLAVYHQRIAAILGRPAPLNDDGSLSPALLSLTPEAKAAWVEFHDAIESELASGGELHGVRDVASKSADNAARLAALFQMFEGAGGGIGPECFESASRIVAWHLNESRRFFGELALPAELADAARLDGWLVEHCRRIQTTTVGKNYVRQHGPLRDGQRLDAAVKELRELDRALLVKDGRRQSIVLNPALLKVAP